jgi:hypothetical protein
MLAKHAAEQAAQEAQDQPEQPEQAATDPEEKEKKKADKAAKRKKKIEDAQEKEAKRMEAIENLHELFEMHKRKYETIKVKVPYNRTVLNFTTAELLRLFGGWFTLTYAFSRERTDKLNSDGTPVMQDFYICSRDVAALEPSERPKKNAAIKALFDKDVYGYALIAPASAFGGRDEEE